MGAWRRAAREEVAELKGRLEAAHRQHSAEAEAVRGLEGERQALHTKAQTLQVGLEEAEAEAKRPGLCAGFAGLMCAVWGPSRNKMQRNVCVVWMRLNCGWNGRLCAIVCALTIHSLPSFMLW